MRNQWVGDIGDFGKYRFLRSLFGKPKDPVPKLPFGTLGVVWCYNEREDNDYDFVRTPPELRHLDDQLYDCLQFLTGDYRNIPSVESGNILPTNTFFSDPLNDLNRDVRRTWIENAIDQTREAKVIFVDADTGIATEHMTKKDAKKRRTASRRSPKHIYVDELAQFSAEGKSLIVYQHFDRSSPWKQLRILTQRFRKEENLFKPIKVFLWHDRFFITIVQPEHCWYFDTLQNYQ